MEESSEHDGAGMSAGGGSYVERPAVPPEPASYAARTVIAPELGGGANAGGPPRDPGSWMGRWIAWLVIGLAVATVMTVQRMAPDTVETEVVIAAEAPPATGGVLGLMSRYMVGAKGLVESAALEESAGDSSEIDLGGDPALESLVSQLKPICAASATDRLRGTFVVGELLGAEKALEWNEWVLGVTAPLPAEVLEGRMDGETGAIDLAELAPEWLREDWEIQRRLYADGVESLTEEERDQLVEHHGWFGELGVSFNLSDTDPVRKDALAAGTKTLLAIFIGAGIVVTVGLAGVVLLIVGLVMLGHGKIKLAYHAPAPGGSVYLETFALFLAMFLPIATLMGYLVETTGIALFQLGIWAMLLAAMWPLVRGAGKNEWRHAIGWTRGKGVVREMGAGVVGYIAGAPVFALGIGLTALLMLVTAFFTGAEEGKPAGHPIIEQIGDGGWVGMVMIYLLAAVWAPVVEETLFRGALYHHLRGWMGAIVAALLSSLIFAVIHPVPLFAAPALMALGFNFAMIRTWRGSIIASMTAHALHNGMLITLLMLALS